MSKTREARRRDDEWVITVADSSGRRWPSASALVRLGVPLTIAADYQAVRRTMSPKGLRRRYAALSN